MNRKKKQKGARSSCDPAGGNSLLRLKAGHTPRHPPDPVSYWLIAERRNNSIEVLTIRTGGEQETLPVFSSQEEAERIVRFEGVTGGWRARESGAGELVSVLSGPCAGVKKVALDPSPEMVVEGTVGLVSLLRESFIGQIMARRSGHLSLTAPRLPQIWPGHLPFLPLELRAEDVRDTDKRPLDTERKEPATNANNFE